MTLAIKLFYVTLVASYVGLYSHEKTSHFVFSRNSQKKKLTMVVIRVSCINHILLAFCAGLSPGLLGPSLPLVSLASVHHAVQNT